MYTDEADNQKLVVSRIVKTFLRSLIHFLDHKYVPRIIKTVAIILVVSESSAVRNIFFRKIISQIFIVMLSFVDR